MKNQVEFKKALFVSLVIIVVFTLLFGFLYFMQYKTYTIKFNEVINGIVSKLQKEYPQLDKNELITILNGKENLDREILREYGIDLETDSLILENDQYFKIFFILNTTLLIALAIALLITFYIYHYKKNKKLVEITNYIEQINQKNYSLDIDDNTEDELSILKNEIYKTTIMLKEVAENAKNQELGLKNSLEDISHQLKTPLTSITIMLDNMIDNPDMDRNTRNEFLKDCKKEITNINFLVQALLKLSKFDANTIQFHRQKIQLKELITEVIQKVSILCDLKNITIQVQGNETDTMNCDFKWQVEAITNLLKNAVEYSEDFSIIEINYTKNQIYTKIEIKDHGKGIDSKELPHIFERFYKGKNSAKDSVGIGLALAKTIIEKDNGKIYAESELGRGTTFVIKYFNQ